MLTTLGENTLANETTMNQQRITQFDYEKLQDEHQSISEELITLNDHNQILSERILMMETDLYAIRDETNERII